MVEERDYLKVEYSLSEQGEQLEVKARSAAGEADCLAPRPSEDLLKGLLDLGERALPLEMLAPLGKALGEVLLCGRAGELAYEMLEQGERRGEIVDFEINFKHEQAGLARFPWEVFSDKDGHFLVREGLVQVGRYLPYPQFGPLKGAVTTTENPLLHIVACPAGMATVEQHIIPAERPHVLLGASYGDFLNTLIFERRQFWGLQFDGHGAIFKRCISCDQLNFTGAGACHACNKSLASAGQVSVLAFERSNGNVDWVPTTEVGALLHNSGMGFAALLACDTARLSDELAFNNLAIDLVMAGAPMVLGMQTPVAPAYASALMADFYKALAHGQRPLEALTQARQIHLEGTWYSPVLYQRSITPIADSQAHYDSRQVDSIVPAELPAGEWGLTRFQVRLPSSGDQPSQANLRRGFNLSDKIGLRLEPIDDTGGAEPGGDATVERRALQPGVLEVSLQAPGCQVLPERVQLFVDDRLEAPPAIFSIKALEKGPLSLRFELHQAGAAILETNHQIEAKDQLEPGLVRLQINSLSVPVSESVAEPASERICPDCGMSNRLGVRFCRHCGAQLTTAEQAAQEAGEQQGQGQAQVTEAPQIEAQDVLCADCGHANRPEVRYCRHCGAAMAEGEPEISSQTGQMNICPDCGHRNRPEVQFCRHCGERLGEADVGVPDDVQEAAAQLPDDEEPAVPISQVVEAPAAEDDAEISEAEAVEAASGAELPEERAHDWMADDAATAFMARCKD
ncbi:CHAT domain-containing protein, partial [Chloroflexota bacterium]